MIQDGAIVGYAGLMCIRPVGDVQTLAVVPEHEGRGIGSALLRTLQGPLFVPFHPFYPVLVGQPPHLHRLGVLDVAGVGEIGDTRIICAIAAPVLGIADAPTFINYVLVGVVVAEGWIAVDRRTDRPTNHRWSR